MYLIVNCKDFKGIKSSLNSKLLEISAGALGTHFSFLIWEWKMFQSSVHASEKKYNKEVWAQLPIRERNHYTSKLNCFFKIRNPYEAFHFWDVEIQCTWSTHHNGHSFKVYQCTDVHWHYRDVYIHWEYFCEKIHRKKEVNFEVKNLFFCR